MRFLEQPDWSRLALWDDLRQRYTNCQIEGDEGTIPRDLLSAAPITGAAAADRMIRSPLPVWERGWG